MGGFELKQLTYEILGLHYLRERPIFICCAPRCAWVWNTIVHVFGNESMTGCLGAGLWENVKCPRCGSSSKCFYGVYSPRGHYIQVSSSPCVPSLHFPH